MAVIISQPPISWKFHHVNILSCETYYVALPTIFHCLNLLSNFHHVNLTSTSIQSPSHQISTMSTSHQTSIKCPSHQVSIMSTSDPVNISSCQSYHVSLLPSQSSIILPSRKHPVMSTFPSVFLPGTVQCRTYLPS